MIKKIFSIFVFTRLYYLVFSPEKVFDKLKKRMTKFLHKDGIWGVKRSLNRRFFSITIGGLLNDIFIISFKNNKKIHICTTDDDTGSTGVRCIELLDLNLKGKAQLKRRSENRQWLW